MSAPPDARTPVKSHGWEDSAGAVTSGVAKARPAPRLEGVCGWCAWLLPLVVGVGAGTGGPEWADDRSTLRDLGLVPFGLEGVLSSVASQLVALLPLGDRTTRALLVSSLALAACSRLAFALCRAGLERARPSRVNAPLALLATQLWAQHPSVRAATAHVGGPALALALVLAGAWLWGPRGVIEGSRERWLGAAAPLVGVVLGLAAGEHWSAAVLITGWVIGAWRGAGLGWRTLPWPSVLAGAVPAAGLCALVPLVRGVVALPLELPASPPLVSLAGEKPLASPPGVAALLADIAALGTARLGVVGAALAVAGLGVALRERESRRAALPWCALLALGVLAVLGRAVLEERAAELASLAASASLTMFLGLALQTAVLWSWHGELPYGKPASVLGVTFAVTLVLGELERSTPPRSMGARLVTEAALAELPPRSVVLLDSPELVERLFANALLRGGHGDVLLVPLPLAARPHVARRLLELEPRLAPLLRQLAVSGVPDEYALAALADQRPLYVELDPEWDVRSIEHAAPSGLWFRFAPQALTSGDRERDAERSRAGLQDLLATLDERGHLDRDTAAVLASSAARHALGLAAVGQREGAAVALRAVERLGHASPKLERLAERLSGDGRGRVAIGELED